MHTDNTSIFSAYRGKKRMSNFLELKLWMVVNHHLDAGNLMRFSSRAESALNG